MQQPEALSELRRTRPVAPADLRTRVAAIAASAAPPRRRVTWLRAALVLVPAVLAVAGGALLASRDRTAAPQQHDFGVTAGAVRKGAPPATVTALDAAVAPAPSSTRLQDYDATLRLRVHDAEALSDATKRAVAIAGSLGGFASVVQVDVDGRAGDATLRLRVPVTKVQVALERLSALGTITGESVSIQDVQPAVNGIDRKIARLQRQLRVLRLQPRTPALQRRIDALTLQVERLQRTRRATVSQARLATLHLELTTRAQPVAPKPKHHGPLDGALHALRWIGIAALYALIVAGPVVLAAALVWLGWRAYRRASDRRLLGG